MNRFAYRTTGLAIKTLSRLSKAKVSFYGQENIPGGSIIFVINHFTRIETLLLPYHIHRLTGVPVWSLAAAELFRGSLADFLDMVGAVSTQNPDRDLLIAKTLLTGEAAWIIFPEGLMVKNKKIVEKGRFMISTMRGKRPPHTGAAALALRTEFYRQRLRRLIKTEPAEAQRLLDLLRIDSIEPVLQRRTFIVPVNVTYYPLRVRENILSTLALKYVEDISERAVEEIMTEGTMLLSGVDVDVRFGEPIKIEQYLRSRAISRDITARRRIYFDDLLPSRRRLRKACLKIMQRYMACIYCMTTVNHDHLFASLLKLMPFKKFDQEDLKRRVFLAAEGRLRKMNAFLHGSLDESQVPLITDDRYGKYRDFIAVARDKGVVKGEGRRLEKDSSKFFSALDFHRVRIENTIAVMANEVEPLRLLQRHLRRLAWTPAFLIRRQVREHLLKKARAEFETDYQEFYIEGESKPKDVGRPFLVKGSGRQIGVILIHGYMAAPLEVRELAEYLGRKGCWVYVLRLKGHGTSPEDLALRTYAEWIASVDEGYAIMRAMCERVFVGGFSTGAGLALDLAERVPNLAGVFAVCPPLKLQDFSTRFVPAMDAWNRFMDKVRLEKVRKPFVVNNPEKPHINYLRNPISGVRELERLMEAVETRLGAIKAPALVVQSQRDPVVDPKGSQRVFELLGSEDKTYALFNLDRHGILSGEGSQRIHQVIGNFIQAPQ